MRPSPPPRHRPTATRTGAVLAGVLLTLLAGCGDDRPDRATDPSAAPSTSPSTRSGELADHDGAPCPTQLPTSDRRAVDEPAPAAPDLAALVAAADAGWACRYDPGGTGPDGGSGTAAGWDLAGPPRPIDPADLRTLGPLLAELRPASGRRVCTMDLGPRWLVVLADAGDLTGIVVDGFGCRDVRLTDDPHRTPPGAARGEGVVPGVLAGPERLLDTVRRAAGAPPRTSPADPPK